VSPLINGCCHTHTPSPFVIITQPKSWYSFYHPTEGGRLSRPRHCRKGAQPVPKAEHRSGCHDKHNWPWPLTPQSIMPSLNHCDLLRHVGANNLPKVVTRQCRSRELNLQPSSCKSNAFTTCTSANVKETSTSRVMPVTDNHNSFHCSTILLTKVSLRLTLTQTRTRVKIKWHNTPIFSVMSTGCGFGRLSWQRSRFWGLRSRWTIPLSLSAFSAAATRCHYHITSRQQIMHTYTVQTAIFQMNVGRPLLPGVIGTKLRCRWLPCLMPFRRFTC